MEGTLRALCAFIRIEGGGLLEGSEGIIDKCKITGNRMDEIVKGINEVILVTCPDCKHPYGYSTVIWECTNPLHLAIEHLSDGAAQALHLGKCVRCGKVSMAPWADMVQEGGHMVYSRRQPEGMLEFCWPCHHLSFDTRS